MSIGQERPTPVTAQHEASLRLQVDGIKDLAIFLLDREGRVASWNAGAQRIKGYAEAEVIGRDFSIFYTAEDVRNGKPARLLRAALTGGSAEDEGWRVRKDGSRFWADVLISRRDGESGEPVGFVKVTRDLTHRKRAGEGIRRLYEISKLLTSFEGVEETLSAIVGLVAQSLPLRSAILIRETVEGPRTIVWQAEGGDAQGLEAAAIHARASYGYLVRSDVDVEAATPRALPPARKGSRAETASSFILLPLVVGRRPIFGALQLETAVRPQELDLVFVNAVVNQLAVALDRLATIEARQASAEVKRAAAELREAETEAQRSWLKTVLDRLPAGVIIADAPGRRLLLANRQAEQIWGRPLRLGADPGDSGEYGGLHPGDGRPYAPEEWPLSRSIAKGESVVDEEIDYVRSDGTSGTMLVSSAPIESPGGIIVSGVATVSDITERKRLERAQRFLAETSAVLGSSLEYASTVAAAVRLGVPLLADVCFLDEVGEDGEIRRIEAPLPGSTQADSGSGIRRHAAVPGLETPQVRVLESGEPLLLADLAAGELQDGGEGLKALRAAGFRSMMVVPLLARGENLGALTLARTAPGILYSPSDLGLAQEVARRIAVAIDNARLYQSAQKATRTRDDLIAAVSHDLRTPLFTIITTADLLAKRELTDEERRKWIEAMRKSADWMKRLIDDLVDIARIEAGHLTIAEEDCSAGSLLEEAVALLQPLAQQKKVRLEARLPGEEVVVACDRNRILRVLSNLIGNAINFTPEGGSITAAVEPRGGEVRFAVSDSGSGIAPAELAHVFERFWQGRKTARSGAGLGLAIARGIVKAHGGEIWAESEPGKGSSFFFTLPS